jgi:hypothetical protein
MSWSIELRVSPILGAPGAREGRDGIWREPERVDDTKVLNPTFGAGFARAREAGTEATLLLGEGMQHDWLLTLPWLDESRRAWTVVADFVERKRKSTRPRD